jgi:hypothetical protein
MESGEKGDSEIMEKKTYTKDELQDHFKNHKISKVVFTKKDGTERTMICSLHQDILPIPTMDGKEKTSSRKPQDHLFRVYDIEADGWRSITIANIISLEKYLDPYINLCDSCIYLYPECHSPNIDFGTIDNVIDCDGYKEDI